MNKILRAFLLVLLPLFDFACGQGGLHWSALPLFSAPRLLAPGDNIDTMLITTGTKDAAPLWALCLPTIKNDHLITVDCGNVSFSRLAIGHTFGVMDLVPGGHEWSDEEWELDLDGQPLDLKAFGIYSFVHPDVPLHPSPIKEVFRSVQVWDVVPEHPTPGAHVVSGHARFGDKTYTWIVNLIIPAVLGQSIA